MDADDIKLIRKIIELFRDGVAYDADAHRALVETAESILEKQETK